MAEKYTIEYLSPPKESLETLLERFNARNRYMVLEEVLQSKQSWCAIYQDMLDILKHGFEVYEIRSMPIKFKIKEDDEKFHTLQIRHLLANMIIWRALIDMDGLELLSEEYIFDFTEFNMNKLVSFLNEKIVQKHRGDFGAKNEVVDEICHHIGTISDVFAILIGMSVNIYDIIQVGKRNPELEEILYKPIDHTLQAKEIEDDLDNRTQRIKSIFINDPEYNHLQPMFKSGNNLKDAQVKELFARIGLKSDLDNNTIPLPIDTNFVTDGLNRASYIYINALSGRKSLILTKKSMSQPGTLSKRISSASTAPGTLRKDYVTCDSKLPIEYFITDDKFLKGLNGRYYIEDGERKVLNYLTDKHLIGQTVPFKSPCTCASKEGICYECYGDLYEINKDLFSVGAFSSLKITNPLGQVVLSSKHTQSTSSDEIVFNEDFSKIFDLSAHEISIKEDYAQDVDLFIMFEDVELEESDDEIIYAVKKFNIVDSKHNIVYIIAEENGSAMYLGEDLAAMYAKNKTKPISLDNFEAGTSLFIIEVKSAALTDPVKIIQKLLSNKDRLGARTLSDWCQKFAEELLSIGIDGDFVLGETVLRSMIRKKSDKFSFPEFDVEPEDYQILHLDGALFNNPSVTISLTTSNLRKQILSTDFYKKSAPSHLDPLFVTSLSEYI